MQIALISLLSVVLFSCTAASTKPELVEKDESLYHSLDELPALLQSGAEVSFKKVVAADWSVERSGLINLKDEKAKELSNSLEAIQIYFYAIDHGDERYLIDSGVSEDWRNLAGPGRIPQFAQSLLGIGDLTLHKATQSWLYAESKPIHAVFLTHMHSDHILGIADLPKETAILTGPGEVSARTMKNIAAHFVNDALLNGNTSLREIAFPRGELTVLDWFGDKSVFVIYTPGHTQGSLSYLIRTAEGPQLIVGDTCHTRWGWENNVAPGVFSDDLERNTRSLAAMRSLAEKIPGVQVHLGHQSLKGSDKLETP